MRFALIVLTMLLAGLSVYTMRLRRDFVVLGAELEHREASCNSLYHRAVLTDARLQTYIAAFGKETGDTPESVEASTQKMMAERPNWPK